MPQKAQKAQPKLSGCYTDYAMGAVDEDYFLNPPPGSAAERAVKFGIDLRATVENLRLTPQERIRKLENMILAARLENKNPENPGKS